MPLSPEQLREVQLTELEMLTEVHRICQKREIPYVIIAGTLLGAVRHGGFIPWDDDVDVALLRKDYERFRRACEEELDTERFVFQDGRNTPGYRWGYGKLRRKRTLFLREHQEDMPYFQGIFLDVFPLDEVPQNYLRRAGWQVACFLIRKCLWACVGKKADGNFAKRSVYAWLDRIPEAAVFSWYHALIRRSLKLTQKLDGREQENKRLRDAQKRVRKSSSRKRYVRILLFPTPNRVYGYEREWYRHRALYSFEGNRFYGIRDADEYLRFKFGRYQELPPEQERKTHPVSRLVLLSDDGTEDADRKISSADSK